MKSLRHLLAARYTMALAFLGLALIVVVALGLALVFNLNHATASDDVTQASITPSFTYQGRLDDGGNPANGKYDFQFSLFDAKENGNQVGQTLPIANVDVQKGVFTIELNFGAGVFTGEQRWLAISVSQGGANNFVALAPRQALNAVPYAMSVPWSGIADMPADFKDGIDNVGAGGSGITGITAGDGLTGGGTSGNVTLSLNFGNDTIVSGDGIKITSTSGENWGVAGIVRSPAGTGVYGQTDANVTDSNGKCCSAGVYGLSRARGGIGVRGWATNTMGSSYGVAGYSEAADGAGIYGRNFATGGKAAIFDGSVTVNGTISKQGSAFKIDHPLDPENKYLYHSVVESPDMMNLYNGNVLLDGNGEAWVQMPSWFEALNMEFRYQLTAIGAPGPNLYIAQEITANQFKIAGGQPGMKVSWLVTGIRHDPYAQAHRIPVEEDKPPGERGAYLSPTEYGQPEIRGLNYHDQQPEQAQLPSKSFDAVSVDIRASQVITRNP